MGNKGIEEEKGGDASTDSEDLSSLRTQVSYNDPEERRIEGTKKGNKKVWGSKAFLVVIVKQKILLKNNSSRKRTD